MSAAYVGFKNTQFYIKKNKNKLVDGLEKKHLYLFGLRMEHCAFEIIVCVALFL